MSGASRFGYTPPGGSGAGGTGDVVGPASATDSGFALFDGTTGKLIKNSAATIGTTQLADGSVTLAKLANQADQTALANNSGGAGPPSAVSMSTLRTMLALVVGTNVQAYSAILAALAGLSPAADRLAYFTGASAMALATLTSFGRSLVAATTDVAAWRLLNTTQALGTSGSVSWDVASGRRATITMTGDVTLGNPTNMSTGDTIELTVNAGTGGWWFDFGSAFEKPPVWSLASAVTTHRWTYDGAVWRLPAGSRTIRRPLGTQTTTTDATTGVVCTGSGQVPPPASQCAFEYRVVSSTSSAASGVQLAIDPGNNTGSVLASVRSTGSAAVATLIDNLAASTISAFAAALSGNTTSPNGTENRVSGHIFGHATAPTAFALWTRAEIGGNTARVEAASILEYSRMD